MMHVLASITAQPEHVTALKQLLTALAAASRLDDGCEAYELLQREDAPHEFVTQEQWRDAIALDAHLHAPHVGAAIKQAKPLLAQPIRIVKYQRVDQVAG